MQIELTSKEFRRLLDMLSAYQDTTPFPRWMLIY